MPEYPCWQEGREIFSLQQSHAEKDERCQRHDLDRHEDGIDRSALARSENQEPGHRPRDQDGGQVDDAMAEIDRRHEAVEAPGRAAVQELGQSEPCRMRDRSHHVARPANADSRGGDGVFQDQGPADHPGEPFAHDGVGIGVGRARNRNHGGQFGIAERGNGADEPGNHEREHHPGPGLLRGSSRQHEYARADNRPDAQHGQLESAQSTMQ